MERKALTEIASFRFAGQQSRPALFHNEALMKTNVKVDLTDDERNRLAILFDGKHSKRQATRKEIVLFVDACLGAALDADPNGNGQKPGAEHCGELVIHDINEGGWSFIGE